MSLPTHSISLPTPFGEAAYGITLTAAGRVEDVQLPLAGLPESVYKLTYGPSWRDAIAYFERLGATLAYRIEAVLFMSVQPTELTGLVTHFRSTGGAGVATSEYGRFWAAHAQWMGVFAFRQRVVDKTLRKLLKVRDGQQLIALEAQLFDFLLTLLGLEFTQTSELVYQLIGSFRTERARTYLLGELERPGRHPFAADLLRGLEHFCDTADTLPRLRAVYQRGKFAGQRVEQYVRGLARFEQTAVLPDLLEVLGAQGSYVDAIIGVWQSFGLDPDYMQEQLVAQFTREQDYYVLDDLLQASLRLSQTPRIDLATLNAKLESPAFVDLPPVNWPQQLEPGWRELLRRTGYPMVMDVVTQYLSSPVPRLQRNAVLQLKAYREDATENLPLPYPIERRLRELLTSRYDKVYVEVMNILGARPTPVLREPERMLDAILAISIGSRYRFVVLTALRRVGNGTALRQRARQYYAGLLAGPQDAAQLERLTAWLPFLSKYLGDIGDLRAALDGREGGATG
ncbi:hypothetical protein [Neolewinella sp.]|uniref:hypothetical protein n=1 Tax=Neolewinella sp. TaxID=2993543 RepID=UPI003B5290A7